MTINYEVDPDLESGEFVADDGISPSRKLGRMISTLETTQLLDTRDYYIDLYSQERQDYAAEVARLGSSYDDRITKSGIAKKYLKKVHPDIKRRLRVGTAAYTRLSDSLSDVLDVDLNEHGDEIWAQFIDETRVASQNLGTVVDSHFYGRLFWDFLGEDSPISPEGSNGRLITPNTFQAKQALDFPGEERPIPHSRSDLRTIKECKQVIAGMSDLSRDIGKIREIVSDNFPMLVRFEHVKNKIPSTIEDFIRWALDNPASQDVEQIRGFAERCEDILGEEDESVSSLHTLVEILTPTEVDVSEQDQEPIVEQQIEVKEIEKLSDDEERFMAAFINGKAKTLAKIAGVDVGEMKTLGNNLHRLGLEPVEVGFTLTASIGLPDGLRDLIGKASRIRPHDHIAQQCEFAVHRLLDQLEDADFRNKFETTLGRNFTLGVIDSFTEYLERSEAIDSSVTGQELDSN